MFLADPAQQQRWPRGPKNALHNAAYEGAAKRTAALLDSGKIGINQGDPSGVTPLMCAALAGHSHIVRILLDRGASVSVRADDGVTALFGAAQNGHLRATKLLIEAGADPNAAAVDGFAPLHQASDRGHPEVMRALIDAGANLNSRGPTGETPLYVAASEGNLEAIKVLLRAKASPLLRRTISNEDFVPLDAAVEYGHLGVVRELIQQLGIKGCGGPSDGLNALRVAAQEQQVGAIEILTAAGVVDTGAALSNAAGNGREASVKYLLRQKKDRKGKRAYVNTRGRFGATPLICGIEVPRPCSYRIARWLVDAGSDTTSPVRITDPWGRTVFNDTPLAHTNMCLREKDVKGAPATKTQLLSLEAVRRLLMRVEAVHAVSWLWQADGPVGSRGAEIEPKSKTTSPRIKVVLPAMRTRSGSRRVPMTTLFRCVVVIATLALVFYVVAKMRLPRALFFSAGGCWCGCCGRAALAVPVGGGCVVGP